MTRPTRDEMLMRQAQIVAERSTCDRAHVGVVIAIEGRIVSQGYNGAPVGMAHCDHSVKDECRCRLGRPHEPTCPERMENRGKTGGCTLAVHGEANAIAFAAKHGVATREAELFTTLAPCLPCAQLVINAGIVRVVYGEPYRYQLGIQLLMDAGLRVEMM